MYFDMISVARKPKFVESVHSICLNSLAQSENVYLVMFSNILKTRTSMCNTVLVLISKLFFQGDLC